MPDDTLLAQATFVRPTTGPQTRPWEETAYETTWRKHLDLIRTGKRKLLDASVTKCYWYEMTLADGRKTILGIGGQKPLGDPPAGPDTPCRS